jgi:hypothetical protein
MLYAKDVDGSGQASTVALFASLWLASKKSKICMLISRDGKEKRLLTFCASNISIFKIKIRERYGKRHYLLEKG